MWNFIKTILGIIVIIILLGILLPIILPICTIGFSFIAGFFEALFASIDTKIIIGIGFVILTIIFLYIAFKD